MQKPFLPFVIIASMLILVGAGCTATPTVQTPQAPILQPDYVGTWERTGTFVNGENANTPAATLDLGENTYVSATALCTVHGAVSRNENMLTLTLDSTDCPTGIIPDVYHSTYEVSPDGASMKLINTEFGATVLETYVRK